MGKTYYRILKEYNKGIFYYVDIEFSDDPDGFFMPLTFSSDSVEQVNDNIKDFLGDNSEQTK